MDYKNGKIYTIRSHQTDKIYIGSTTQPLSKRLSGHKGKYKCYLNGKDIYLTSFEILKFEDVYIELLEECPCDNKNQLFKREGELIRAEPNCVNKVVAGRTDEQYRDHNRDKILEKKKEYYTNNTDKHMAYQKQYRELNRDKINANQRRYRKQKKMEENILT